MKDGSNECTEVMKIRDIVLLEKKQMKSFFKAINVLRIYAIGLYIFAFKSSIESAHISSLCFQFHHAYS